MNQKYKTNPVKSTIRIIGHSLGGALATIMSLDMIWNVPFDERMNFVQKEKIAVRTFGSPCVGNAHFVGLFNEQVIDSNRYFITLDPGKEYSSFRTELSIRF